MKTNIRAAVTVFAVAISSFSHAQLKKATFHGGFIYPVSSHGLDAANYSNAFSVHALAGVSGEERGFAGAGIALIVKQDAKGFQASGIANIIGGNANGFTTSGIINTYRGGHGFQHAGIANIATDSIVGMQAAGVYNQAQYINGFQAAGVANVTEGSVEGVQAAGIVNIAKDVDGSQLSGFLNTANDVSGSQFAGFLNIARKVKGVQVSGFINLADSSEYPIGIINLIRNGEQSVALTADDNQTTLLSFRSGSRKMYGIFGMGTNFKNEKEKFAVQVGLGAHLFASERFRLKTEITHTWLENFKRGDFSKQSLAIHPSLRLGKIDIFAGPTLSLINTSSDEGKALVKNYLWEHTNRHNQLNGLYIGYVAGIQWRL